MKFKFLIHSDMYYFKDDVKRKGGIWASDDVYFSQHQSEYTAAYRPAYPANSEFDRTIIYNHITGKWNEYKEELTP